MAPLFRRLRVKDGARDYEVLVCDGMASAEIEAAARSRTGADGYFAADESPDAPVVPLSAALPDGFAVHFHAVQALERPSLTERPSSTVREAVAAVCAVTNRWVGIFPNFAKASTACSGTRPHHAAHKETTP